MKYVDCLSVILVLSGVALNYAYAQSEKKTEPPPNPLIKKLEGAEFVELRSIDKNKFLIRRMPKAELKQPGREISVVYVAKEFVRLRDIHREPDGKVDLGHARKDR